MNLLDIAEQSSAARLFASPLGGLLPGEKVADLFCGAGGWGEGAKRHGIRVDFAIDHDLIAIETHRANNRRCKHHRGDAWRTRPRAVIGDAKLGLLLASAACTTHSRARGKAPISKRVHMLGWCISRWMKEAGPRMVEIENVVEWLDWGPMIPLLDAHGKPVLDENGKVQKIQDPARKGQYFKKWWRYCQRLGYVMEMRVLDAPDFGGHSRRKRLFIKGRRDGAPIVWPEKTHGKVLCESAVVDGRLWARGDGERLDSESLQRDAEEMGIHVGGAGRVWRPGDSLSNTKSGSDRSGRGGPLRVSDQQSPEMDRGVSRLKAYATAAQIIDWSDLGTSIFERSRPLKPKTLARIVEGIRRHVLNDPKPFLLRVTHGAGNGWHVSPIDGPMPTQTTRHDLAVCVPIVAPQNGGVYGQGVNEPGPTITTKGHQALITPILTPCGGPSRNPEKVSALMGTVLTREDRGLCVPVLIRYNGEKDADPKNCHSVNEPLYTVPTENRFGVVTPVLVNNTSGHSGARADGQVPTITTGGQGGIATPVMAYLNHGGKQTSRIDEPMRTVLAQGTHAMMIAPLMMEYYGNGCLQRPDEAIGALRTHENKGLVCCVIDGVEMVIVDILFRMLKPSELAAAMGFPADFKWPKTKRDTVRCIGNAVHVDVAAALIGSSLPRMRGSAKRRVAV